MRAELTKKRKSPYNEFNSIAMQWANHPDTKPGDLKILNRNGKQFVLLEATNDGFVELKSGKYTEVEARYERVHRKKDRSFHAYTQEIRSKQDGNMWDMQYVGDGGYASRDGEQIGIEGLQTDSTRNDEYLRNSNKEQLEDVKFNDRIADGYVKAREMQIEINQLTERHSLWVEKQLRRQKRLCP